MRVIEFGSILEIDFDEKKCVIIKMAEKRQKLTFLLKFTDEFKIELVTKNDLIIN